MELSDVKVSDLDAGELIELLALVGSSKRKKKTKTEDWGWQIVILQRGWVMVGQMRKTGYQCVLHSASVIRRWGTTMGLPELAERGPLEETKLETATLPVRFHYMTVIATLECSDKWRR